MKQLYPGILEPKQRTRTRECELRTHTTEHNNGPLYFLTKYILGDKTSDAPAAEETH